MHAPKIHWFGLPLVLLSPAAFSGTAPAQGNWIFDARYRYESVEQDNALDQADAQTLRTRLGFQSDAWRGFSALVEADNVSRIGGDAYNDTRNGHTRHSVIADPEGSEINQALVRYDSDIASAALGRQRINFDNQRFIGGVGWRQNEQTFDGGLLQWKPLAGLTASYAYLNNINTVFGPDDNRYDNRSNPANIHGHSQLLNIQYRVGPALTATAYAYWLGLDDIALTPSADFGSLSSVTRGLRLNGQYQDFRYTLEYAHQGDYADNPLALDSEYSLVEFAYDWRGMQFTVGRELLGGDNGPGNRAFQTPLATKHAFQGWADVFLTTPADGIADRYAGGLLPLAGGKAQVWYHDFRTDRHHDNYGSEWDLAYAHPIPALKGLVALIKYARYDSRDSTRTVDTEKLWLQVQYSL